MATSLPTPVSTGSGSAGRGFSRLSTALARSPGDESSLGALALAVQLSALGWTLTARLSIIAPMTMLYRLDAPAAEVAAHFAARTGDDPWERGHVAPGRFAPVITSGREFVAGPRPDGDLPRRMVPRLWGVPPPASAGDPARAVLTVRNVDSPFWIGNLRNSEFRCLVPATAFMEWGRDDPATGRRRQLWISCSDQPLFALAAVWKDSEVPAFALLTCQANAALRSEGIERMPVILSLDPADHNLWLNGSWDRASTLVAPYASSMLRF